MTSTPTTSPPAAAVPWSPAPHMRAPETSRGIFAVTTAAALAPLLAGTVFFGWRALWVAALSIGSAAVLEGLYFRVTRSPALASRSHALLTGTLLALTLPPFVAWYVPVIGAAFAIIVGKAVFGGVGHFLWQPALVGRLAVSAMFMLQPTLWPLLAPDRILTGDASPAACRAPQSYRGWRDTPPPPDHDGFLLERPVSILRGLTDREDPRYGSLLAALLALPPIDDPLWGAVPGGIGETSALIIALAGLFLVYRHYVNWMLPTTFVVAAAATVAVAPVYLHGAGEVARVVWLPLLAEGFDVGFTYVNYHVLCGELLLAAFFLAPEMTSRPVTPAGQVLFGIGCGVTAMVLRLYYLFPLPCYAAVLAMNTLTPLLERLTRPRVLGQRRWWQRKR